MGNHFLTQGDGAWHQIWKVADDKVKSRQAENIKWDNIMKKPPEQLKVLPLAAVPHKYWLWRAILGVSFMLWLLENLFLSSMNENTVKTAQAGAIDPISRALLWIIHGFAKADECAAIYQAKWGVSDGFWQMFVDLKKGWNFCYMLPQNGTEVIRLVVPLALLMGWVKSPHTYICIVSEMAQGMTVRYIETEIGALPPQRFQPLTKGDPTFLKLPDAVAAPWPFPCSQGVCGHYWPRNSSNKA